MDLLRWINVYLRESALQNVKAMFRERFLSGTVLSGPARLEPRPPGGQGLFETSREVSDFSRDGGFNRRSWFLLGDSHRLPFIEYRNGD